MNEPSKLYISEKLSQNFTSKIQKLISRGRGRLLGTVEYVYSRTRLNQQLNGPGKPVRCSELNVINKHRRVPRKNVG